MCVVFIKRSRFSCRGFLLSGNRCVLFTEAGCIGANQTYVAYGRLRNVYIADPVSKAVRKTDAGETITGFAGRYAGS